MHQFNVFYITKRKYNSQKLKVKAMKVIVKRWIDKENTANIYHGILFSFKKKILS